MIGVAKWQSADVSVCYLEMVFPDRGIIHGRDLASLARAARQMI
jgi:hypothetical protein